MISTSHLAAARDKMRPLHDGGSQLLKLLHVRVKPNSSQLPVRERLSKIAQDSRTVTNWQVVLTLVNSRGPNPQKCAQCRADLHHIQAGRNVSMFYNIHISIQPDGLIWTVPNLSSLCYSI